MAMLTSFWYRALTTRLCRASRLPLPSRPMSVLARSSRLPTRYARRWTGLDRRTLTRLQVNPDIVGGLVVEIGDRTIDLSVSSKLAKMNKLLTDTL
jgi:hypothetical protein